MCALAAGPMHYSERMVRESWFNSGCKVAEMVLNAGSGVQKPAISVHLGVNL